MADETFEEMLAGGHPNSLGRTEEVVAAALADPPRLEELYGCYQSADAVVRLRVSSALKRVQNARPGLLIPLYDRLIDEIGALDQASAQWTLAQIFDRAWVDLTPGQRNRALAVLRRNLEAHHDWIVLNHTMETLACRAEDDAELQAWLLPLLERHARDPRKSVARRAERKLLELGATLP